MTTSEKTIFGRILDGEIPCHRVYEDEHVLAFLDVGPLSRGHTLVIPRERAARLDELSDEAAAAVGRVLPRVCRAVMAATGAEAYNVITNAGATAGQAVMHVHFHVIPRFEDAGLAMDWRPGTLDPTEAETLAADLRARLGSVGGT